MKRKFLQLYRATLLSILALLLMVSTVIAQDYFAVITFAETSGNSYDMLAARTPFNTPYFITNGYITTATGLDTRVRTNGTTVPHMLSDDKLLFAYPLPAYSSNSLYFYTGMSTMTSFDTIIGYGGSVAITDHADLELANDFVIEQVGWINTDAGANKHLVYKEDAFNVYISDDTDISAIIARDVLEFTTIINSGVDCGNIYSGLGTLWMSFWFKLDVTFDSGAASDDFLCSKEIGVNDWIHVRLESADGKMYFSLRTAGVTRFNIAAEIGGADVTSWTAGTWYHVVASISAANAVRFRVNNDTAVTDPDTTAIAAGAANFVIGNRTAGGAVGIAGRISDFCVGTDDLSTAEETALYNGAAPGDETDFWYMDEGIGVAITSYGSAANPGTAGAANTWGHDCDNLVLQSQADVTATGIASGEYELGITADTVDLEIFIDSVSQDSATLSGESVPDNANNWTIMMNNCIAYLERMRIWQG